MKTIAYIRVSKDTQDTEGQKLVIHNFAQAQGLKIDKWIEMEISSRKSTKDRGIDSLLAELKRGDHLVISEYSRLGRSISELSAIVEILVSRKIRLTVINQPMLNLTYSNGNGLDMGSKLVHAMFGAFSEMERDLISQRTKYGLAKAKAQGKVLGNPRIKEIAQDQHVLAVERAENYKTLLESYIANGLTERAIAEELNKHGHKGPRGGVWSQTQVRRTMEKLNLKTMKARS